MTKHRPSQPCFGLTNFADSVNFSASYKAHKNPLDQDLGDVLSGHNFGMKVPLVSEETDFQHVDIFEVINP